jgi:pimeloyl-ACP methyl ester carboxylesterase
MMPFEVRRSEVSGGGLAYVDLGEGPPVVLLHGFPTSSYLWRREIPLLASRMRVIAPDLLGYGTSDKPEEGDLSEPAQARYVGELLESLGVTETAVVAHDIGGAVAQLLALDSPIGVAALVLLDSACFDAWPIEGVKMLQAATPDQQQPEFVDSIIRLTFDLGIAHPGRLSDSDLDAYLEPWRADPAAFFRAVRGITGSGLAGREAELGAFEGAAMVIWGEQDPFLPPELGERLGELLGATVALLPGCSHFVNEDAPSTVGPIVYEYLRSRYLHQSHTHHEEGPVPVFLHRPSNGGVAAFDPPGDED